MVGSASSKPASVDLSLNEEFVRETSSLLNNIILFFRRTVSRCNECSISYSLTGFSLVLHRINAAYKQKKYCDYYIEQSVAKVFPPSWPIILDEYLVEHY